MISAGEIIKGETDFSSYVKAFADAIEGKISAFEQATACNRPLG